MTQYNVGDSILGPLPTEGVVEYDKVVATVIGVEVSELATINAKGEIHFYHPTEVQLISDYKTLLHSITQKGVELIERATGR